MARVKEPHFFSQDLNRERAQRHGTSWWPFTELPAYLWLFRDADRKVAGESSVLYLYSKEAAARIAEFNADAKIIAMVREPVEFLHSLHAMQRFVGEDDSPTLARALELEEARRSGRNLPAGVRIPSLLYYSDLARFSEQIERYLAHFPRQQVKVIVFDDLRRDPEGVYRDVLEFIGVDPAPRPPSFAPRNQNRIPRSLLVANLLRGGHPLAVRLYRDPAFPKPVGFKPRLVARLLPHVVWAGIYRVLNRLNAKWAPREPLDAATKNSLRTRFEPEVRRLSSLLDRDLVTEWGYGAGD